MLHHAAPLPTRWYLYPFRRTKQSVLQVLDSGLCPRENHVGELCRLLDSPCLQGVGEGSTPGGAFILVETPVRVEGENEYNTEGAG